MAPTSSFDMALEAPVINTSPGPAYAANRRRFQGIPGIERTAGGLLWATWYCGGPDQPDEGPGNYVVIVVSRDNGHTWSEPQIVIHPTAELRAFDPVLWCDSQGRLWLFWAQSRGTFDGRAGVWAILNEQPDSATPQWSEPRRLSDGVMMNKPTVLQNGDWLLPVAYWAQGNFAERGEPHGSHLLISRDEGATFEMRYGPQVPEVTFDEHMTIERTDGSLWLLTRTRYGYSESFSRDHGVTWSVPRPATFATVNSRIFIRRLRSGSLWLVKHGTQINERPQGSPYHGERSHLTAFLSTDDGQSWQGDLLLDEREAVSYPDGCQLPDDSIAIIYDRQRTGDKEILMATFTESDVVAGSWHSPLARPRVLINRATWDEASQLAYDSSPATAISPNP